jgi:hypothetical protein
MDTKQSSVSSLQSAVHLTVNLNFFGTDFADDADLREQEYIFHDWLFNHEKILGATRETSIFRVICAIPAKRLYFFLREALIFSLFREIRVNPCQGVVFDFFAKRGYFLPSEICLIRGKFGSVWSIWC